jgi:transposase
MELESWPYASQGVRRVINVEDWAEIRRLHRAEGMGVKAIARRLGVARNTVRTALRSSGPPSYERERKGSIVDAVEPQILQLLRDCPDMPATVVAERIGWDRSIRVLRERVAELRPLFVAPDPCQRTTYRPGELAQFDLWQPDVEIPLGYGQAARCWVIVGVSGFSRFLGAWMIPSRQAHDVLGGHLQVLRQFGALPRMVVWDQEGAIGQWRGPHMAFSEDFQRFRGTLGIGARLCQRGDPEAKGLVERANGYLETDQRNRPPPQPHHRPDAIHATCPSPYNSFRLTGDKANQSRVRSEEGRSPSSETLRLRALPQVRRDELTCQAVYSRRYRRLPSLPERRPPEAGPQPRTPPRWLASTSGFRH